MTNVTLADGAHAGIRVLTGGTSTIPWEDSLKKPGFDRLMPTCSVIAAVYPPLSKLHLLECRGQGEPEDADADS